MKLDSEKVGAACRAPGPEKTGATNSAPDNGLFIREVEAADRVAIFALYQELQGAYAGSPGLDLAEQERLWQEIREDKRQHLLVAESEGQVIGTLTVVIIPNLGHGGRPWAAIDNVVVAAGRRQHGVGAALMAAAGKIAGEHKCYKLVLSSNLLRKEAHEFYKHLGWRQTHLGFSLTNE